MFIIELEQKFGYDKKKTCTFNNLIGMEQVHVVDRENNSDTVCFSGIFLHNRVAVFQENIYKDQQSGCRTVVAGICLACWLVGWH